MWRNIKVIHICYVCVVEIFRFLHIIHLCDSLHTVLCTMCNFCLILNSVSSYDFHCFVAIVEKNDKYEVWVQIQMKIQIKTDQASAVAHLRKTTQLELDPDKNCWKSLVMTRINPPKSVIDRQARLVEEFGKKEIRLDPNTPPSSPHRYWTPLFLPRDTLMTLSAGVWNLLEMNRNFFCRSNVTD